MLLGADHVGSDGFIAQRLAGFQPIDAFDQNKASIAFADLNWALLDIFYDGVTNFFNLVWVQLTASCRRDVYIFNFYHYGFKQNKIPCCIFEL